MWKTSFNVLKKNTQNLKIIISAAKIYAKRTVLVDSSRNQTREITSLTNWLRTKHIWLSRHYGKLIN